jgi:cobalamin biosynthesis protein CobD/CbiB
MRAGAIHFSALALCILCKSLLAYSGLFDTILNVYLACVTQPLQSLAEHSRAPISTTQTSSEAAQKPHVSL